MVKDDNACPACQGRELDLKYKLSNPHFHTARCRTCSFVAMHPYPSDEFLHDHYKARELYNSDSDKVNYGRAVEDRAALIAQLQRLAGVKTTGGRAVDFGAGVGIAVAAQASLGFEALGIETNPQAQKFGREVFGVEIVDIPLSEMPEDLRLFTLFEVLEHIKYPRDFLIQVHQHLLPEGVIAGSVPNYNGLARYLRGKASIALAWPEHVNQFTPKTLAQTLESAGYEVVYIGFPPPYGVVITLNLRGWLRKKLPSGSFTNAIINLITWVKKHLIYPLPNRFAEKTGLLGHGLVFVAKRSNKYNE
jgi:2-polyprenyl-3-methyl-5-hydroxy-6-metoxy-1,4-benzoquinol methylase